MRKVKFNNVFGHCKFRYVFFLIDIQIFNSIILIELK